MLLPLLLSPVRYVTFCKPVAQPTRLAPTALLSCIACLCTCDPCGVLFLRVGSWSLSLCSVVGLVWPAPDIPLPALHVELSLTMNTTSSPSQVSTSAAAIRAAVSSALTNSSFVVTVGQLSNMNVAPGGSNVVVVQFAVLVPDADTVRSQKHCCTVACGLVCMWMVPPLRTRIRGPDPLPFPPRRVFPVRVSFCCVCVCAGCYPGVHHEIDTLCVGSVRVP